MAIVLGYRKTYPRACRECGDRVFVHTNGYGDWVLFDELGPPWPIHPCYEERTRRHAIQRTTTLMTYTAVGGVDSDADAGAVVASRAAVDTPASVHDCGEPIDVVELVARMMRLFGRKPKSEPESVSVRVLGFRPTPKKNALDLPPRQKIRTVSDEQSLDIERCEPAFFLHRELIVTGFVHDIHTERKLERLARLNSIGYVAYRGVIGSDSFTQITVIDSDLVSYTAVVPVARLPLQRGSMVTMSIRSERTPRGPLFVCTSLDEVEFTRHL